MLGFFTSGLWLPNTRQPGTKRIEFTTILQLMQKILNVMNETDKEWMPSHCITFDATCFTFCRVCRLSHVVFQGAQSEVEELLRVSQYLLFLFQCVTTLICMGAMYLVPKYYKNIVVRKYVSRKWHLFLCGTVHQKFKPASYNKKYLHTRIIPITSTYTYNIHFFV